MTDDEKAELFKSMVEDLNDSVMRRYGLSSTSTLSEWQNIGDWYEENLTQELLDDFLARYNDPEVLCHSCGSEEFAVANHLCSECDDWTDAEMRHHEYMNGYDQNYY